MQWCHIIDELNIKNDNLEFLVTTTTLSSGNLAKEQFDKYFLTSPMLPFADVLKSLRVDVATPQTIKELKAEITKTMPKSGLSVIYYQSDTDSTLRAFRSIRDAFDQEFGQEV